MLFWPLHFCSIRPVCLKASLSQPIKRIRVGEMDKNTEEFELILTKKTGLCICSKDVLTTQKLEQDF